MTDMSRISKRLVTLADNLSEKGSSINEAINIAMNEFSIDPELNDMEALQSFLRCVAVAFNVEVAQRFYSLPTDKDGVLWREDDLCLFPDKPGHTFFISGFGNHGLVEITDKDDGDSYMWAFPDELARATGELPPIRKSNITGKDRKSVRRPMSDEDICFLSRLQQELLTQDTVSQADPRFWVIRDTTVVPCWDEQAEYFALYDDEGIEVGKSIRQIDAGKDISCVPVKKMEMNRENTMFLTLREAKDHIAHNKHHYDEPKPFAMTAWRSPQVEKLIDVLQHVDWDALKVGDAR